MNFLMVGLGGFIGAILRYSISLIRFPTNFPVATLVVNTIGCLAISIIMGLVEKWQINNLPLILLLTSGLLGGFTTFSAFGLETITLFRNGQMIFAILNICANLILGLSAIILGRYLIKA